MNGVDGVICDAGRFAAFVYSTGATSLLLSLFSLGAFWYTWHRLNGGRYIMPFRRQAAKFLACLAAIKVAALIYFLWSISYQIAHNRPVCRVPGDLSYFLSWADWTLIFLLATWPAAVLLVLLRNMFLDLRDDRDYPGEMMRPPISAKEDER